MRLLYSILVIILMSCDHTQDTQDTNLQALLAFLEMPPCSPNENIFTEMGNLGFENGMFVYKPDYIAVKWVCGYNEENELVYVKKYDYLLGSPDYPESVTNQKKCIFDYLTEEIRIQEDRILVYRYTYSCDPTHYFLIEKSN